MVDCIEGLQFACCTTKLAFIVISTTILATNWKHDWLALHKALAACRVVRIDETLGAIIAFEILAWILAYAQQYTNVD